MKFAKVVFSPSEAEKITGMTVETQRNNRRAGYLAKQPGHARFDLFDLLSMAFMTDAAKFGIGPKFSVESAEWVAHHALYFALMRDETFDKKNCYQPSVGDGRAAFTRLFGRPRVVGTRVAVLWADGSDYYAETVDQAVDSLNEGDPRIGQPMMVIDLSDFASRIVSRIGKPTVIASE